MLGTKITLSELVNTYYFCPTVRIYHLVIRRGAG
jgi:hypothetical protein